MEILEWSCTWRIFKKKLLQANPETPDKESKIKLGEYSTHPEATISLTTKLYFLSVTNNGNV